MILFLCLSSCDDGRRPHRTLGSSSETPQSLINFSDFPKRTRSCRIDYIIVQVLKPSPLWHIKPAYRGSLLARSAGVAEAVAARSLPAGAKKCTEILPRAPGSRRVVEGWDGLGWAGLSSGKPAKPRSSYRPPPSAALSTPWVRESRAVQ